MKKHHNPIKWAAGVFSLSLAAGMGIGAQAGAEENNGRQKELERVEAKLLASSGQVEEANRNLIRTQLGIGETCLTAVKIYLPGGKLAPTPEDAVVDDLMGSMHKPCGDTPSNVRANYREITNSYSAVSSAESDRKAVEDEVDDAEMAMNDSNIPEGIGVGVAVGGGIGLMGGFLTGMLIDISNPLIYNRRY